MGATWALAGMLLFVAIVLLAIRTARAIREAIEREQEKARKGTKEQKSDYGWIGHIHGLWGALGAAAAGLKFIYKEWRTAPPGSWQKLGWGVLLALIVALAMYAILKLVDRKLNGAPAGLPVESSEDAKA